MKEWVKITLFVSLFASFRDFRPVDSFYATYMTSPAVNFTAEQVIVNSTLVLRICLVNNTYYIIDYAIIIIIKHNQYQSKSYLFNVKGFFVY